jgi:Fe-S-cluster containining protein
MPSETPAALQADGAAGWHCRLGCGACCIALSISSPIPGMPLGKAAGVRCVQLSVDHRCLIFAEASRPAVCARLRPEPNMCGRSRTEAMHNIAALEAATRPDASPGKAR